MKNRRVDANPSSPPSRKPLHSPGPWISCIRVCTLSHLSLRHILLDFPTYCVSEQDNVNDTVFNLKCHLFVSGV